MVPQVQKDKILIVCDEYMIHGSSLEERQQ